MRGDSEFTLFLLDLFSPSTLFHSLISLSLLLLIVILWCKVTAIQRQMKR